MKIVINKCFGGFGLSAVALSKYKELTGKADTYYGNIPRDDPALISIVEEMQDAANGQFSKLRVVEIPDGTEWEIEEYDGSEWVSEKHQTWR